MTAPVLPTRRVAILPGGERVLCEDGWPTHIYWAKEMEAWHLVYSRWLMPMPTLACISSTLNDGEAVWVFGEYR